MSYKLRIRENDLENLATAVVRCSPPTTPTASHITLTAAQIASGLIVAPVNTSATNWKFPHAKLILAAFPGLRTDEAIMLWIRNKGTGSGIITVVTDTATSVTLAAGNTNTVGAISTKLFLIRFTSIKKGAEACTVYSMVTSAY